MDGEDGGTVYRHIAEFVDVDVDLGVLELERACREWHLGTVELGAVGHLAGASGSAAAQVVDQRTVEVVVAVIVVAFADEVARVGRGSVEGKVADALLHTIDADIHIAVHIRCQGEAYLTCVREALLGVAPELEVDNGCQRKLNS